MKNLLIITYYFPPERNVGSIRVKGLAKFLPYLGWNVFVLVPFFPQRESKEFNIIEVPLSVGENIGTFIKNRKLKKGEFSDKIPFNVLVTSFLRDIFPFPDNKVGWVPIATYIGKKIVRKYNISAIISSYSPATTHLVAYEIKKSFSDIFWIADYRDLWTQNPYLSYSSFTKNIYRKFEKKIISEANTLTTVSSPMAEELKNFHSKPTFSIPNGFDPDEFNFPVDLKNKFTITYAGGLYSLKRNPRPLLIAISELIKEGKMKEKNIKVEFYGPYENALEKMIKELKLEKIVKYCGNIERKE
ncbi:MAG TPA: glycosyltransferase, partial [Candidatus Ratteibacteria bacterium]|nr:glycosyltransferase [Candidatus Ratteibacteria bacterium]